MVGIASHGASIPWYQLNRFVIFNAIGWAGPIAPPPEERAVAESYAGTQVVLSPGYIPQSFIGCHHLLVRISFLNPASVVNNRHKEETRPVEIDIGI